MRLRRLTLFVVGVVFTVACSGPSQTADDTGPAGDMDAEETGATGTVLAKYETFDVSAYPVQPPERTVEVNHEVPRPLLEGRADEGVRQTVEGFRIQVFSAQDKEAAQSYRERVRRWWEDVQSQAPEDLFKTQPPIVIEYSQPYYRVRFGAFAERETASEALEFVQREYEGAFVAQATVTVIR